MLDCRHQQLINRIPVLSASSPHHQLPVYHNCNYYFFFNCFLFCVYSVSSCNVSVHKKSQSLEWTREMCFIKFLRVVLGLYPTVPPVLWVNLGNILQLWQPFRTNNLAEEFSSLSCVWGSLSRLVLNSMDGRLFNVDCLDSWGMSGGAVVRPSEIQ